MPSAKQLGILLKSDVGAIAQIQKAIAIPRDA